LFQGFVRRKIEEAARKSASFNKGHGDMQVRSLDRGTYFHERTFERDPSLDEDGRK
jgi:hypothetical protein